MSSSSSYRTAFQQEVPYRSSILLENNGKCLITHSLKVSDF